MDLHVAYGFFVSILLLGHLHRATSEPAQCENWKKVFPDCECKAALDDNGQERPSVAVVDCSSKNLTAVPRKQDNFTRTLYEFRLNDNQIDTLPADAFQGIKIRHLDLTGNNLGDVDENAFQGTTYEMINLAIQGNGTNTPQKNALSKLTNLEKITMKNYNVPHLGNNENHSYFLSYRKLRTLILDNWRILSIEPQTFFTTLWSITLINQPMQVLPLDLLRATELQNLKKLQISHTKIKAITLGAFEKLHNIKEINLANNEISTIEAGSFQGAGDTLEKLDLSHNFLGANRMRNDLPHLSDLTNLTELVLKYNELVAVPKLEYLGNGQPFKLDLANNVITKLSSEDLGSFKQRLEGLDISLNKIYQIDNQAFSGVNILQSLIMNNQRGDSTVPLSIPSTLTQAASSLTYLDLAGKKVDPTSLWQVLGQLPQLKTVILHSVQLTSIPDFAFRNLGLLTELDLSHNSIAQITDKTFVGPQNLEKLALIFTGISELPACLFYMHTGSKISLDLSHSRVKCDCSVKTIVEGIQNGSITFPTELSVPGCLDGSKLTSKTPADFSTCEELQCENYYLTTPTPTDNTTDNSGETTASSIPRTIQIKVEELGINNIKISWTVNNANGLRYFKVTVSDSEGDKTFDNLKSSNTELDITSLKSNEPHIVCVYGYFTGVANQDTPQECETVRTKSTSPTNSPQGSDDNSSASMGIIAGCVVGGLALLAIIAAIVYLLLIRRRPKKAAGPTGPVQPRTFAKSELPSMNGDSRSFVKVKKGGPDAKEVGAMQVVAISDGQNRPASTSGGRVGRAHLLSPDGTYTPMDKSKTKGSDDYEPMGKPFDSIQGNVNEAYENDHGSLPPTPGSNMNPPPYPMDGAGYVNDAFSGDSYEEVRV